MRWPSSLHRVFGGLVLPCVLGSTPLASQASCAWVLWRNVRSIATAGARSWHETGWQVNQTFATMEHCQSGLVEHIKDLARTIPPGETWQSVTGTSGRVVSMHAQEHRSTEFLCAPDTVDPREPGSR